MENLNYQHGYIELHIIKQYNGLEKIKKNIS